MMRLTCPLGVVGENAAEMGLYKNTPKYTVGL